jgi:threonine aldolase
MTKIRLNSDYSEGAHQNIMDALQKTNLEATAGYGSDPYTQEAVHILKNKLQNKDSDVYLFVGGTQTNLTLISAALRPHQSVLSAHTGHINVHEAGAIEATGHKVEIVKSIDGKLQANDIKAFVLHRRSDPTHPHMTQPKMVYVSQPTELGTIYSKDELKEIYDVCKTLGLFVYIDGARLGYAIASSASDTVLSDYSVVCDALYIGITKIGALFGEALVLFHDEIKKDFNYIMKQKGAILAKGRLLGIQFIELFKDGLYDKISKETNEKAYTLRDGLKELGIRMLSESSTNQQFPIVENKLLKILDAYVTYEYIEDIDETHTAIRFCTSWATKIEDIHFILNIVKTYIKGA